MATDIHTVDYMYALAGLRYAWPGASWRCCLVVLEWVSSLSLSTDCAWLLAFTVRYHRLHCSNLEPLPASSRTIPSSSSTTITTPSLSPSLSSRVHVPALALRSSAFSPAATDRQKKSIPSPPAPPYPLRPPPVLLRPPPLVTLCPHFCFVLRLHHNELCVTRPRRHACVCTSACENSCDR
jgi:hypothetical protein